MQELLWQLLLTTSNTQFNTIELPFQIFILYNCHRICIIHILTIHYKLIKTISAAFEESLKFFASVLAYVLLKNNTKKEALKPDFQHFCMPTFLHYCNIKKSFKLLKDNLAAYDPKG